MMKILAILTIWNVLWSNELKLKEEVFEKGTYYEADRSLEVIQIKQQS